VEDERDAYPLSRATALEHLTGPRRGTATWLSGSDLDVSLSASRFLRISETRPGEPGDDLVGRLRQVDGTYEVVAIEGQPVWVNGVPVTTQKLEHRDMIEFGETGPLSRFRIYGEDWTSYKMFTDILSDGLVYLRVSRQPIHIRAFRTFYGIFMRLMQETTLLYRVGVIIAIFALAAVTYQQDRLNVMLQQQIKAGSSQLESFAAALARTRGEALTPSDLKELRQELGLRLSSNAGRLAILEQRTQANARVIALSKSLIVFLQGSYGFRESSSQRMLRHIINENGQALVSPRGQPLLALEGNGPVAERKFTGTGFAVGDDGALVTNRHVALPWENDANVELLSNQGFEPVMIKFIAYMPGKELASAVELVRASEESDLAILRRKDVSEPVIGLKLADLPPTPGDEVIVMGYPTGLRSMLAQSGEDFLEELQKSEDTGFWSIAAQLAAKGYIAPLASRGIVSQTTAVTIVFDAETTLGGSGGPVLDSNGSVVAVSTAILPEFGGSNLGVPVAKLRELLEQTD